MRVRPSRFLVFPIAALASACTPAPPSTNPPDLATTATPDLAPAAPRERGQAVATLLFARKMQGGVSAGFDIDNYTAAPGDPRTCGHESLKSPEGAPGIDNQMSDFVEALDKQYANAVDAIVQEGINNGMMLIGLRIKGADDLQNDPSVDVELVRLKGPPVVGADKRLDPNQTFDPYPGAPVSRTRGAIKDGVFEAQPFEMALPVALLTANFTITLRDARLRLKMGPDGGATGVLGGRVLVQNMLDGLLPLELDATFKMNLPALLEGLADLGKDPMSMKCKEFSAAIKLENRPAFINP